MPNTAQRFDERSPLRYDRLRAAVGATDAQTVVLGVALGRGRIRDVMLVQTGAGEGGTSWKGTVKVGASAACSTDPELALEDGACKVDSVGGVAKPEHGTAGVVPTDAVLASGVITLVEELALGEKVTVNAVDYYARAKYATAVATITSAVAGNKLTIGSHDFVGKAKYASNIVTCASVQAGDKVTVHGLEFTAVNGGTPTAVQFDMSGTNAQTAAALAAAIAASTHPWVRGYCSAANVAGQATVTISATIAGARGNLISIATNNATRLGITTAGGKLAGAYDAAADEWPLGSGTGADAASAAALAAAINASTSTAVHGKVTAAAVNSAVTVTAVAPLAAGNLVTISATGTPIALTGTSGGKLSGAADPAANDWVLGATLALSAAALRDAINATTDVAVTARAGTAIVGEAETVIVTVTAADPDPAVGNALTLVGDTHLTVTGSGTLEGGVSPLVEKGDVLSVTTALTGSYSSAFAGEVVVEVEYDF